MNSHYRAGSTNPKLYFTIGECSLGLLLVGKSEKGLSAIFIGDDADELLQNLQVRFPKTNLIRDDEKCADIVAVVANFIESPLAGCDLPLDIQGTAFQHRVWDALRTIPAGSTATYTDIANMLGSPTAVRAVASACAANALAVLIPCHRVIRNDGSVSGYRWGVERKETLLKRESA